MTRLEWNSSSCKTNVTPPVGGIARCSHVHDWPVLTCMERVVVKAPFGDYYDERRVVVPAECPTCGERYDEVEARYFE